MKTSYFIIAIFLSFVATVSTAQVAIDAVPYSRTFNIAGDIPTVTMPGVDAASLLREDSIEEAQGMPFRFGFPFDVDYGLDNSGRWDTLASGDKIWRLRISCPRAYSINLLYSQYPKQFSTIPIYCQ